MKNADFLAGGCVGMRPVMVLEKTDAEGNPFGMQRLEILCFNVDGKGGALIRSDGAAEGGGEAGLEIYAIGDVRLMLQGDEEGTLLYREIPLLTA
jgi:hypothetical protein